MRIPNLNTETARFPGDWKHLSLFSGSGIGDLAARAAGIETVAHAENDPACCYCLERLWPDARLFRDVRDVTAESVADLGRIDIISGGFPCQDVSTAGKGEGLGTEENPTRSGLWYEFARVIRETRPRWVLIENVPALRVRGGDRVCSDLEAMAYKWEAVVVGAWAVGAPHKRDRVWIVAHKRGQRCERREGDATGRDRDWEITGRWQGNDHASGQDLAGGLDNTTGPRRDRPISDTESDSRDQARMCVPGERCTGETVADATQQREREQDNEECPEPQSGDARQDAGWRSGGELADSDSPRLPLAVGDRGDARQEQQAAVRGRWPARPGEPQHAWEAPRLVEFGLGGPASGLARRIHERLDGSGNGISPDRAANRGNKTLLKMCGNSWVYPLAVLMFRAIRELDREML